MTSRSLNLPVYSKKDGRLLEWVGVRESDDFSIGVRAISKTTNKSFGMISIRVVYEKEDAILFMEKYRDVTRLIKRNKELFEKENIFSNALYYNTKLESFELFTNNFSNVMSVDSLLLMSNQLRFAIN